MKDLMARLRMTERSSNVKIIENPNGTRFRVYCFSDKAFMPANNEYGGKE